MPTVSTEPEVVTAKPIRLARVGWACSAVVLIVFVLVALVMRQHTAGAHFLGDDRIGTIVIGVILAGLFVMPSRPRLRADADGIHIRAFLGGYRDVPWNLVMRVEFPSKVRFARLVLPGEETLAVYAVSRYDGTHAVAAMNGLRALHAIYGPQPRGRQ